MGKQIVLSNITPHNTQIYDKIKQKCRILYSVLCKLQIGTENDINLMNEFNQSCYEFIQLIKSNNINVIKTKEYFDTIVKLLSYIYEHRLRLKSSNIHIHIELCKITSEIAQKIKKCSVIFGMEYYKLIKCSVRKKTLKSLDHLLPKQSDSFTYAYIINNC